MHSHTITPTTTPKTAAELFSLLNESEQNAIANAVLAAICAPDNMPQAVECLRAVFGSTPTNETLYSRLLAVKGGV